MPGGRPTNYKEEYITKVDEYLELCQDEEFDWTKTLGDKSESWEHRVKVKLPTLEGFSLYIDASLRVLADWEARYPEFLRALDKIRSAQKERLIEKGLSGDYNPTIAKLILSSNHGMNEKTETDIKSGGEKITAINYVIPNGDNATSN